MQLKGELDSDDPTPGIERKVTSLGGLRISPDGKRLVFLSNCLRCWDITGHKPRELWREKVSSETGDGAFFAGIQFLDNDQFITTGHEGGVLRWKLTGDGD